MTNRQVALPVVVEKSALATLIARRARGAIFGVFAVNGFLFAMWVVHIPTIERRTGISHATLGSLLLLLGAGAILGMQTTGPLADRYGSHRLVTISGVLLACALLGPALSTHAAALGISLFILGTFNGALDVAMNSQAVDVERLYPRPIMSAFHALFSIGGVLGSLVGAATLAAHIPVEVALGAAAILGGVGMTLCRPYLLVAPSIVAPSIVAPSIDAEATTASADTRPSPFSRRVLSLGALAFALLLSEGVANDWSTLQVKEHLGASDEIAALAFGFFAAMMTLGRFCADRVSARFGPVAVVRYGSVIAGAGMLIVLVSESLPLTLAGWAAFGLGLSGGVPQIFTSAGNLGKVGAATNMSRVVGMGYVGFLAGPAVIGWLSSAVSLTNAMTVPLTLTVVAAVGATIVKPPQIT